ncbi:hypothetical protein HF086_000099 [Spodoptera exigua]|uniref:Uncharacterized protein n=1 Tax=Spodoptera exigua TaxID=7107 RepID=A0A922SMY3_SPOEX|nr:hypothetical protein HF086_000099 [Spodoptera exigua]
MGNSLAESKSSDKEGDTKIIYKKSNAAFYSHSRTVSGVSQSFSRSGILQIKKNLENNHYYEDRGKLKRDLSVETDICILRRYYRGKKNKLSTRDGSAKSKYSTVIDTEIDIIDEFPDMSACGDNDTDNKSSTRLDIASLMIDNLKDLLNQWIQEHLIENKDNKQKIDSVIHTIFDKFDKNKTMTSSSGSTYVLHKETTIHEVKDKKVPSPSFTCYYCKQNIQGVKVRSSSSISQKESSVLAIPFKCKDIRIISTLSIPRSFHKKGIKDQKSHSGSWYKAKKIKHKNIILSIDKSKKVANSSSFDLLAISTKSLLKKYTNYDVHVKKKKRHIVFIPKPLFKSATESSSMTNNEYVQLNTVDINKGQLDDMPSLMKSLFNELEIADNLNKHIQNDTKNDNCTMTENESKIVYNVATEKSNDNNIQQSTVDKEAKYEADDGVIVSIDPSQDQQKELANIEQSKSINNSQQTTIKKNYKKTVIRDKLNKHRRLTNKLPKNFKIPKYKNINKKNFISL